MRISTAIVIGPTPPGTGVSAPATPATAGSTSPTSPASVRLMPTSITVAPGFTQSALTNPGMPTAATTISAPRTCAATSRVRLWTVVTVALSFSSNAAIGLPTMFERPITTASIPDRSGCRSFSSITHPSGVHGTSPSIPVASRPALTGWNPSTSLSGSIRVNTARSSIWRGSGSWTRMPSTVSSAFSRSTSAISASSPVSAGRRCSKLSIPAATVALPFDRT